MFFSGAPIAFPTFQGNPNVTITAIDSSGGIDMSRTSGRLPAFVQVSASAIAATGSSTPYEDLSYGWNFGDTSGTETFTNPVTGETVNANHGQTGPEAAYCYRTAGTYTITLTIRGKNGGSYTDKIVSTTFEAQAWSPSVQKYCDSNAGGTNAGTQANPYNDWATLRAAMFLAGADTEWNFKRGSDFSVDAGHTMPLGKNGLRIQAYGTGANPIIRVPSGVNQSGGTIAGASGVTEQDIVISNIDFIHESSTFATYCINIFQNSTAADAIMKDIYLDNCNFTVTSEISGAPLNFIGTNSLERETATNFGIWNCDLVNPQTTSVVAHGVLMGNSSWCFIVGGSISGASQSGAPQHHHIYYDVRSHSYVRWVDFGDGPGRVFCINGNCHDSSPSFTNYDYHFWADCNLTGSADAIDISNTNNTATGTFRYVVIQGNDIHDLTISGANGPIQSNSCDSFTIRDCDVWSNTGPFIALSPGLATRLSLKAYRMNIYHTDIEPAIKFNNSADWTEPQQITDVILYMTHASAFAFQMRQPSSLGSDWFSDRNQFYAPNRADHKYFKDNTTAEAQATWQAHGATYDPNSTFDVDPGWTDPANGDFS